MLGKCSNHVVYSKHLFFQCLEALWIWSFIWRMFEITLQLLLKMAGYKVLHICFSQFDPLHFPRNLTISQHNSNQSR